MAQTDSATDTDPDFSLIEFYQSEIKPVAETKSKEISNSKLIITENSVSLGQPTYKGPISYTDVGKISISKDIDTICDHLKHHMQNLGTIEFNRWMSTKINDIRKALSKEGHVPTKREKKQMDFIERALQRIYFIQAKEFASLVYTSDINNIYKQWTMFNSLLFYNRGHWYCTTASKFMKWKCEKWPYLFDNTKIVFIECMKKTNILKMHQMSVINRCIRNNSKNYNMHVPACIAQIVALYYEPMSFYSRIKQLFQHEIDIVLYQTKNIDQKMCEILNRLEQLFHMIGDDFEVECCKDIEKIFGKLSEQCGDKYLSDEIGIMEYTNKVEKFKEKWRDNYLLGKQCINVLIPSYIQSILNKNHGNYEGLVKKLTKSQLKRIYKLFVAANYTEARRLNNAYKINKNIVV